MLPVKRRSRFCPKCGDWWAHTQKSCVSCRYAGKFMWMTFAASNEVATNRTYRAVAARYGEKL